MYYTIPSLQVTSMEFLSFRDKFSAYIEVASLTVSAIFLIQSMISLSDESRSWSGTY